MLIFISESKWRFFEIITMYCCHIIKEVSTLLASKYNIKKWIKLPTIQGSQEIKQKLYNVARFPEVIGAIDCTHIPIKSPGGDDVALFDRLF